MPRILNMLAGVGLGVCLSQFPEFAQQYEQRLGGAVDELETIIADFDSTAARAGLSRTEALLTYESANNDFLTERGIDMTRTFARHARLTAYLEELQTAGPVERVIGFARYYDPEIASRALQTYEPALPVTPEGLGYTLAGFGTGYGGFAAATALLRRSRRQAAGPRHS